MINIPDIHKNIEQSDLVIVEENKDDVDMINLDGENTSNLVE